MTPERFCTGPCGRPLEGLDRPLNRHGKPGARCRTCYRFLDRQRWKAAKWRRRKARRALDHTRYWRDPEKRRACRRACYQRAKAAA